MDYLTDDPYIRDSWKKFRFCFALYYIFSGIFRFYLKFTQKLQKKLSVY